MTRPKSWKNLNAGNMAGVFTVFTPDISVAKTLLGHHHGKGAIRMAAAAMRAFPRRAAVGNRLQIFQPDHPFTFFWISFRF